MRKLYFLLITILLTSLSFSQTVLYQESFESNTNGTNYTTSVPEFTDGFGDFFLRTDGSDIGSFYEVSGFDGSFYFAGQDLDGEGATLPLSLSTASIDVTGLSDIDFAILLAEDDDGTAQDWDDADYVHIFYSVDGGAEQNLIWIEGDETSGTTSNSTPRIDTNFDGTGDGTEITSVFAEFVQNIPLSGNSSIVFRIEINLNSGDEDIAFDNIRAIDGFVASPTITLTAPTNGTEFSPGTTSVDVEWTTANTTGSETVNVIVNTVLVQMGATSPYQLNVADGQSYDVTIELVDGGVLDSDMSSFSVGSLVTVADIAALRADVTANGLGRFYEITGGALVTHTDGFRNRHWIEDTNVSGILIYDDADIITPAYSVGDMVSGLRGTTEEVNGILRFIPTSNSGSIDSSGNSVTPQIVSITDLNNNIDDYESEFVRLQNVTFVAGDGVATFSTGTNYDVTDGANTIVKRTDFFSADYIGGTIPSSELASLDAVTGEFNGTAQIYVRSLSDFTLSDNDFQISNFTISPNPTSTGLVTINSVNSGSMDVAVYDILGKQVKRESITNTLDVSSLRSGVYILKISQNNATSTRKLVIK